MGSRSTVYWDSVAEQWAATQPQRLWRLYCDRLNTELLAASVAGGHFERALKTDLFDEANSNEGLHAALAGMADTVVGIDVSLGTMRAACANNEGLAAVGADVCELPFADGSFDLILSNSTLDHMDSLADVAAGLAELQRVLRPGGRLVLTLDNLANPAVALRAALPYRLLSRLHLVPYYVGATCGPRRLRRMLEATGFATERMGAMMHCPRVPAVIAANALDRRGNDRAARGFIRFLLGLERLERLPTRYVTGYFVTVTAVRA
jgi:SAM-dependent methyltransferase